MSLCPPEAPKEVQNSTCQAAAGRNLPVASEASLCRKKMAAEFDAAPDAFARFGSAESSAENVAAKNHSWIL